MNACSLFDVYTMPINELALYSDAERFRIVSSAVRHAHDAARLMCRVDDMRWQAFGSELQDAIMQRACEDSIAAASIIASLSDRRWTMLSLAHQHALQSAVERSMSALVWVFLTAPHATHRLESSAAVDGGRKRARAPRNGEMCAGGAECG
jgi:hypothetical protein